MPSPPSPLFPPFALTFTLYSYLPPDKVHVRSLNSSPSASAPECRGYGTHAATASSLGNEFQMAHCPVGQQEELKDLIDIIAQLIKCSKRQPNNDSCVLRELMFLEH